MPSSLIPWLGFHLFLLTLLAAEYLFAAPSRHAREAIDSPTQPEATPSSTRYQTLSSKTALRSTLLWVAAALAFAVFILIAYGRTSATEYLAGYAIEEALSIDNLFVFLLLFRAFRIEPYHQPRVLFWGVAGAILMRGLFIAAGIGLLTRFRSISYVFGAVLLIAAVRLLFPEKKSAADQPPRPPAWLRWLTRLHPISERQDKFFVREPDTSQGHRRATVLLLALIAIELTDVVFALDSIPAVLSITRSPLLAYTSNIMAVMGLRSLFFLLAGLLEKLRFLHFGLAAVLAFAAAKMLAAPWLEVGPLTSLAVILTLIGLTIAISLLVSKKPPE